MTGNAHDHVYDEIADKYRICGTLVPEPDAMFEILEVEDSGFRSRTAA
jgi:hypothetical protein